jgi:hypothetical protein
MAHYGEQKPKQQAKPKARTIMAFACYQMDGRLK